MIKNLFFEHYKEPTVYHDPDTVLLKSYQIEQACLALEELEEINDVLNRGSELSVVDQELIDLSIQAVLTDFDIVEIDGISLEEDSDDSDATEKKDDIFIVRMMKRIWEWINKAVKWLLEKLGFDFSDKDLEKKIEDAKKTKEELEAAAKEDKQALDSATGKPVENERVLKGLGFMNKEVKAPDLKNFIIGQGELQKLKDDIINAFIPALTVFTNTSPKVREAIDFSVYNTLMTSFDILEDVSNKSLRENETTNMSEELLKTIFDREQVIQGSLRASTPLFGGGKFYSFRAKILALEELESQSWVMYRLHKGNTYPESHKATLKTISATELIELIEELLKVWDDREKKMDNLNSKVENIKGTLELLQRNAVKEYEGGSDNVGQSVRLGRYSVVLPKIVGNLSTNLTHIKQFADHLDTSLENFYKLLVTLRNELMKEAKKELDDEGKEKDESTTKDGDIDPRSLKDGDK